MAIIVPIIAKFVDEGLNDARKKIQEAEGGWAKTAETVKALEGPAKAVTVAMAGAAFAVAKNAGGALKANAKLAASFKAVGYEENAKAAIAYADSLQQVIGVSDEEIQATMQKLAAFQDVAKSQDLMAKATMAAADMSAAGFGTMDSAATALGKALQDPEKNLGALTRMGVSFNKQQREQIKTMTEAGDKAGAQAVIMKEVEGTFGGVAEASASGTAKMKLAWDEAAETIGTVLVPVLGILNAVLTKVANFAEEHSTAFLIMAGTIATLAAGIWAANAAMKAWAVATKVAGVATKVFGLILKSSLGVWGLIITAVVLLAVLIVKNWDKILAATKAVWGWISGFLTKTWDKIKDLASKVWDGIVKVVQKAWEVLKRIIKLNPFVFILTHLDWIKDKVGAAWDWIKDKVSKAWAAVKGLFKGANPFQAIKDWLDTLEDWVQAAFDWITDKFEALWSNISGVADKITGAFNKAKDLVGKLPLPGKSAPGGNSAAVVSRGLATPVARQMVGGVPVPQAAVVSSAGGGGGVQVVIQGALDPDAVGRQVKRLLENHDIRQGRVRGAARRAAW